MNKQEHISAHVMALFRQNYNVAMSLTRDDDTKLMDRWQKALKELPNDGAMIDKLFEPFYNEPRMPKVADVRTAWWRQTHKGSNPASEFETGENRDDLDYRHLRKAATSAYGKAVCDLIRDSKGKLTGLPYYVELKRISDEHGVDCPSPEDMMLQDKMHVGGPVFREPFTPGFRKYLTQVSQRASIQFAKTNIKDYRIICDCAGQADLPPQREAFRKMSTQDAIQDFKRWLKISRIPKAIIAEVC